MNLKIESVLTVIAEDEKTAIAIVAALKHEEDFKKRSISSLKIDKNKIIINVGGDDVVAVRASLNAYLRDLQVFEGVNKIES
ncbi:MAG: KEOPS complex subunit Pcc1 [Candidatus Micrarchaeota archaeon]|nr:KEOPS complex subunit Pcc1 [Candidatus Micrarchaeota archaeon]